MKTRMKQPHTRCVKSGAVIKKPLIEPVVFYVTPGRSSGRFQEGFEKMDAVTEILCYGDSNTYGYDPRAGAPYHRLPRSARWTGILNQESDLRIINEGMNGREIPHSAWEFQNMDAILRRSPNAQILLLMLGTNDILGIPGVRAQDVATRMRRLFSSVPALEEFRKTDRKVVLISPVPMTRPFCSTDMRLTGVSRELGGFYRRIAEDLHLFFTDAASYGVDLSFDGTHYSEAGHRRFAEKILRYLRTEVLGRHSEKG